MMKETSSRIWASLAALVSSASIISHVASTNQLLGSILRFCLGVSVPLAAVAVCAILYYGLRTHVREKHRERLLLSMCVPLILVMAQLAQVAISGLFYSNFVGSPRQH